jgi:hypothetical protein
LPLSAAAAAKAAAVAPSIDMILTCEICVPLHLVRAPLCVCCVCLYASQCALTVSVCLQKFK